MTVDIGAPGETELAVAIHVVDLAGALADMRGLADAISTTQVVEDADADVVERLLPALASRFGVNATFERQGHVLTVRLWMP